MLSHRPPRRSTLSCPRLRPALACLGAAALAALAGPPRAAGSEPVIERLAGRLAASLAESELQAVAVVDLTDLQGEPTELGRYVAEKLSGALVEAGRRPGLGSAPRVIDRFHLARILEELELSTTGLLDPEEVRRVGELAGVDGLVTGSLVPFADAFEVHLKVLDVRSGENLFTDEDELPRTPSLEELEDRPLRILVPCAPGAPLEVELDVSALRIATIGELEIALGGCVRLEGAVHCLFTVTDRGGDGNVYVYGKTRAVLPGGPAVGASRLHLGGETATGSLSTLGATVVQGVPTSGSAVFEGIPPGVELFQTLELHLHGQDARFGRVPIRRFRAPG